MRDDPDALAKKILGMGGEVEGDGDASTVDTEGAALESAAAEAAEAMGLTPDQAPALVSFAHTILRLARES